MSELYNKAIDNFARQLHAMQVDAAKFDDKITMRELAYHIDYDKLPIEIQEWYRQKARQILNAVPEICIVDREVNPIATAESYLDYMQKNDWVKEVKE